MQKQSFAIVALIALLLPGCGKTEITTYDTIEKEVRRANQKSERVEQELGDALSVLTVQDEAQQEHKLKALVIRKNKTWGKKDWLAFSWRRVATGLHGYEHFPFHTYKDFVDDHLRGLKRSWNVLSRIKVVDVNSTRNKLDEQIKQLAELSELIETHDRYLQESDKMGLILTRRQY